MITISLSGYKPSPRFDGTTWRTYKVQESLTKNGPWVDLQSAALSPLDSDPTNPAVRNFTVNTDTIDGWYRVVFADLLLDEEYTIPRWNHQGPNVNYLPTVDQVARKILSRTKDNRGNLGGTFTASTTPTDEQVEQIIFDAVKPIADVIGDIVPDELLDDAQDVVALKAAMQVELSFYPDQVNTGRSIYPQLKEELEGKYTGRSYAPGALTRLSRAVVQMNEGETTVTNSDPSRMASFGGFTETDPITGIAAREGWMTRRW